MTLLANILIDGIAYGMVLFIIAVGLSVTLGLMRFVNLAHGAFAMTGGYIAAWLVREQGLSFYVGVPLAVLATGLLGALLEVTVLRRLYRRTELQQVLFTIGLTFLFVATANLLAGPEVQLIPLPPALSFAVDLGIRTLPAQRLLVIASGLLVVLAAFWVLNKSRFGVWLRATVDNTAAASALGIPVQLVYVATFAVGAALAGLGGILGAELMPLEPYYPVKYLVLVLVVVAVGGMGSIAGSLAASLTLGIIDTASKYLASDWGSLFFFLAMALLLAWRPHGLLVPRKV
ncbi:MAG: branched-chain amino acid ABC transporter permease [Burkholderiaceae bacterium]|uniref:branched-chain amino acid ABC transporter permease n=1 Tax=Hydrogenophaga sp. TaxID=1904254 RepID=UPI00272F69FA|nr:branched-chain amino acid ABC transporter permease [Hydrogenophaga sp.]MDP2164897.1 branched-chain amino acid ABC transporter permease [Hydrogenophaga sp.]MDP3425729.1 branched-chain amino acid ABC transporter permease [Burkholderiaceae bacterium]